MNMRKYLALFLCFVMCLSLLPVQAQAEETAAEPEMEKLAVSPDDETEETKSADLPESDDEMQTAEPEDAEKPAAEENHQEDAEPTLEEPKTEEPALPAEPVDVPGEAAIEADREVLSAESIDPDRAEASAVLAESGETGIPALALNVQVLAEITVEDGWAYFSFTPTESGEYLFYSSQDYYQDFLNGAVYNAAWKELKSVAANDLLGNFTLRCELNAGETYYFGARFSAINITGSFPVRLVPADFTAQAEEEKLSVSPGQKASLHVIATGNVTYQWYQDGPWYEYTLLEGETSDTLITEVNGYEDYFCIVTGPSGVEEGIHFSVYVDNRLKAVDIESGDNYLYRTVGYGDSLTMTIRVDCLDSNGLMITWKDEDQNVLASGSTSYTVKKVEKSATYYVEVEDRFGSHAYVDYNISIDNGLNVTLNDDDVREFFIAPRETVSLQLHISARNMDGIHITWERYVAVGGYYTSEGVVAEDVDRYVTAPAEASQRLYCLVTDCYGNKAGFWIDINIENHLKVVPNKEIRYIADGETTVLSVSVTADDLTDLRYYWEEVRHWDDGTVSFIEVEGEDSAAITVGPMAGKVMHYNCIVTDRYGTTIETGFQVYPISAVNIRFDATELLLSVDSRGQLTVISNDTEYVIDPALLSWKSEDPTVASVSAGGAVTGKKVGKTVVTASMYDVTLRCEVRVGFYDVMQDNAYYFAPVYWAADNGITKGYSGGVFGVGWDCTRRELLTFMWRFAGQPTGYGDARKMFNDMGAYGPSTAANKAVAWAYSEGIVKGYADGGIHPDAPIIRKDVMIMLYRLAGKPAVSGMLKFTDCQSLNKNSDTYKAILWGSQNGITKGYNSGPYKGQFGNNLNCLREQIVTFLYRYNNIQ